MKKLLLATLLAVSTWAGAQQQPIINTPPADTPFTMSTKVNAMFSQWYGVTGLLKGGPGGPTSASASDVSVLFSGCGVGSPLLAFDGSCQSNGGGGTVTQVTLAMPTGFTVNGSPCSALCVLNVGWAGGTTGTGAAVFATAPVISFSNGGLKLVDGAGGVTTLNTANAGASNFTLTLPALTDTVATLSTIYPSQVSQSGNFLTTNGTSPSWTPINATSILPSQTGQGGDYLTTDGTVASWGAINASTLLPSQTGQAGNFLTTNGTAPSWAAVSANSLLPSQTGQGGKILTTDGSNTSWTTQLSSVAFSVITGGTNNSSIMGCASACSMSFANAALQIYTGAGGLTEFSTNNAGGGDRNVFTPATDSALLGMTGANLTYTVSTLPTCGSTFANNKYQFAVVTDASAPTYNGALTGGGSTVTLAWCNGSAWTAH